MKIFHSHGSKERLFEMFRGVNGVTLNEEVLSPEDRNDVVDDFVRYVVNRLKFGGDTPKIKLSYDDNEAQIMKSYGRYNPKTNEIFVIAKNRNLGDILRTIAHELIHLKQDEDGKLNSNSGETGSNEENEANALAGVIMREYGKNNPKIFE